jgi:hypothetical protein
MENNIYRSHNDARIKRKELKNNCYRCGHYSNECYAKIDIDGDDLDSD